MYFDILESEWEEFLLTPLTRGKSILSKILTDLDEEPLFVKVGENSVAHMGRQLQLWSEEVAPGRQIYAPNTAMREVHRRLMTVLGGKGSRTYAWADFAATARYANPAQNAYSLLLSRKPARYLYHLDLKDAFGQVKPDRLAEILFNLHVACQGNWLHSAEEAAELLERYFMLPGGGLVQGGPAAPYLFECYAVAALDDPLESLRESSSEAGLRYSRYVDDLLFSSRVPIGKRKRAVINKAIRSAGFEVNTTKTRIYDLARGPVVINGVGVRRYRGSNRLFLPREKTRKLEGLLHLANRGNEVDPAVVHGLMGLFLSATPDRPLNATERRVVSAYNKYRISLGMKPKDYYVYRAWFPELTPRA